MRLGIVSDIHEDAERLAEALRILEKRNCDEIACLGDIVGFDVLVYRYLDSRNASRCLAMVRENCRHAVIGNHDLFAVRRLPAGNSLFTFPANWYAMDFRDREELGRGSVWLYEPRELSAMLGRQESEYLASLPEFLAVETGDARILFSHSLYPDLTGSLLWRPENAWDFHRHFQFMEAQQCAFGFSGHLHPPGLGRADHADFSFSRFRKVKMGGEMVQYICPCTASTSGRNGVLVLDTKQRTVEAVPLKAGRYAIGSRR